MTTKYDQYGNKTLVKTSTGAFHGYGGETAIKKEEFGLRNTENALHWLDPISLSPRRLFSKRLPFEGFQFHSASSYLEP